MESVFNLRKIWKRPKEKVNTFRRLRISADGTMEHEGELAVDVYQTEEEIVVIAPLAGVKKNDISLRVEEEVLIIEGKRAKPKSLKEEDFLVQECFWGRFSKRIILPVPAENEEIKAEFKDGILKVRVPKAERLKTKVISIN